MRKITLVMMMVLFTIVNCAAQTTSNEDSNYNVEYRVEGINFNGVFIKNWSCYVTCYETNEEIGFMYEPSRHNSYGDMYYTTMAIFLEKSTGIVRTKEVDPNSSHFADPIELKSDENRIKVKEMVVGLNNYLKSKNLKLTNTNHDKNKLTDLYLYILSNTNYEDTYAKECYKNPKSIYDDDIKWYFRFSTNMIMYELDEK